MENQYFSINIFRKVNFRDIIKIPSLLQTYITANEHCMYEADA